MGVIYSVSCRDCKVTRDLDKFYGCRSISNRKEALLLSEDIKSRDSFRAGLLASFMAAHMGHNCTVFTDTSDELSEALDPDCGSDFKKDTNFWQ